MRILHHLTIVSLVAAFMLAMPGGAAAETPPGGTVVIDLAIYTCPAGTDSQAAPGVLAATCLEPAKPWAITVGDGQTWADGDDGTGQAPQTVRFEEIPAGVIQVVEALPAGMTGPMVYCAEAPTGATGEYAVTPTYRLESDWEEFAYLAFAREVADDTTLTCQLFNFLPDDAATPERATEPGIDLTIRGCPARFDAASTLEALAESCQEQLPPIGILVRDTGGYSQLAGEISPTANPQHVFMDGVPAGDITIAPQLPDGYDTALVSCAEGDGALQPVPLTLDGAAPWNLQEGATLTCQVFVVPATAVATPGATPAAGPATITVVVHGCPAGVDPGSTAAQFSDTCTGHPTSVIDADVFDEGYVEDGITSGIAGENTVRFEGVPAGAADLAHTMPLGATTLAVYCTPNPDATDPATWTAIHVVSGMGVSLDLSPGAQLTCHWFTDGGDVAGDASGSTLQIQAWRCPPGAEPGIEDDPGYYPGQCELPDPATTFTLTGPAGAASGTQAGEWTTWTGLPPGEYVIDGTMPEGFGDAAAECWTFDDTLGVAPALVTDGQITLTFPASASQVVYCNWFSIPATSPAG